MTKFTFAGGGDDLDGKTVYNSELPRIGDHVYANNAAIRFRVKDVIHCIYSDLHLAHQRHRNQIEVIVVLEQ